MKTEEVISIALASGLYQDDEMFFSPSTGDADVHISDLEYFAKRVAAAEREACARLCNSLRDCEPEHSPDDCAAAIRAKGDMFTKSQNVNTSAERVHESDKSDMAHRSGGLSVEQKPVAAVELITIGSQQIIGVAWFDSNAFKVGTKLYARPIKPWVTLTNDELDDLWGGWLSDWEYARLVEAKLQERNT